MPFCLQVGERFSEFALPESDLYLGGQELTQGVVEGVLLAHLCLFPSSRVDLGFLEGLSETLQHSLCVVRDRYPRALLLFCCTRGFRPCAPLAVRVARDSPKIDFR